MATRSISLSIEESLLAALDAQAGNRSAAVTEAIELWLSHRRIQALEEAYGQLDCLEEGDLGAACQEVVGMGAAALGSLDA